MITCTTTNKCIEPDWKGVFTLGNSWPDSEMIEDFQNLNETNLGRRSTFPKTATTCQGEDIIGACLVATIAFSPIKEEISFETVETALPRPNQIVDLLTFVKNESQLSFREELANMLDILFEPEPIPELGKSLSIDSVSWLLCFLEVFPKPIKLPALALSQDGKLLVSWLQGKYKRLYFYFQDNGTVQYVLRFPNPTKLGYARRMTGEFSLKEDDPSKLTSIFNTFQAFAPWCQNN